MNLTREHMARQLAERTGLSIGHLAPLLDSFLEALAKAIADGQDIEFRGFGSFRRRWRPGHPGRNPKTGERHDVPGHYAIRFTPSPKLKKKANRRMP